MSHPFLQSLKCSANVYIGTAARRLFPSALPIQAWHRLGMFYPELQVADLDVDSVGSTYTL